MNPLHIGQLLSFESRAGGGNSHSRQKAQLLMRKWGLTLAQCNQLTVTGFLMKYFIANTLNFIHFKYLLKVPHVSKITSLNVKRKVIIRRVLWGLLDTSYAWNVLSQHISAELLLSQLKTEILLTKWPRVFPSPWAICAWLHHCIHTSQVRSGRARQAAPRSELLNWSPGSN